MTPLEERIMQALRKVGQSPSRFKLLVDAGVDYSKGYYAIETLAARGLLSIEQPEKTRKGKAATIRLVYQQVKR